MHTIKQNSTNGPVDVHEETLIHLLTLLPFPLHRLWMDKYIQAFGKAYLAFNLQKNMHAQWK